MLWTVPGRKFSGFPDSSHVDGLSFVHVARDGDQWRVATRTTALVLDVGCTGTPRGALLGAPSYGWEMFAPRSSTSEPSPHWQGQCGLDD